MKLKYYNLLPLSGLAVLFVIGSFFMPWSPAAVQQVLGGAKYNDDVQIVGGKNLTLLGSTSGSASHQAQAAAGTYVFKWPNTDPTVGQNLYVSAFSAPNVTLSYQNNGSGGGIAPIRFSAMCDETVSVAAPVLKLGGMAASCNNNTILGTGNNPLLNSSSNGGADGFGFAFVWPTGVTTLTAQLKGFYETTSGNTAIMTAAMGCIADGSAFNGGTANAGTGATVSGGTSNLIVNWSIGSIAFTGCTAGASAYMTILRTGTYTGNLHFLSGEVDFQ